MNVHEIAAYLMIIWPTHFYTGISYNHEIQVTAAIHVSG